MRLTWPLALILLVVTAAGCRGKPPSLLLVTVDTLRADHLGCYGHPGGLTPHLDRLAASGVRFADAYTTAPITAPAHASLFTGRYPLHHGVRTNGLYVLEEEQRTLAEVLAERGYETAAFVGAVPLDHRFGLAQGFATYDDDFSQSVLKGNDPTPWYQVPVLDRERRADEVVGPALAWLERHRDRPFFLWVHLFDPHSPYAPPPPFDRRFVTGRDPRDPSNESLAGLWRSPRPWHRWLSGITDSDHVRGLYQGEVAFADQEIGRLLAGLERVGGGGDTVVAVIADHGEGLGEHGEYFFHGDLVYEPTLRVPFLISAPGLLPAGVVAGVRARGVDLLPTLLELLGAPAVAAIDGESLVGAVRAGRDELRPVLGEAAYRDRSGRAVRAYLEGQLKLVAADGGFECYDLATDPGEMRSLCDLRPADFEPLRAGMEALRRRLEAARSASASATPGLPPEVEDALKSLGYAH